MSHDFRAGRGTRTTDTNRPNDSPRPRNSSVFSNMRQRRRFTWALYTGPCRVAAPATTNRQTPAHVGVPARQPHMHIGRRRDHPRSATITGRSNGSCAACLIWRRVPSGRVMSMPAAPLASAAAWIALAVSSSPASCQQPHRHKAGDRRAKPAFANLSAPVEQQAGINVMARRDRFDARPGSSPPRQSAASPPRSSGAAALCP